MVRPKWKALVLRQKCGSIAYFDDGYSHIMLGVSPLLPFCSAGQICSSGGRNMLVIKVSIVERCLELSGSLARASKVIPQLSLFILIVCLLRL